VQRRRLLASASAAGTVALAGCLDLVYPRIEGRVVEKVVRGGPPGNRVALVVADLEGVRVEADGLRGGFGGRGTGPLRVDDALAARLRGEYGAVVYALGVVLSTRDAVTGVDAGERARYLANRPPWNAVAVGDDVRARVARFGGDEPRLASVEAVGTDGG
jgi:hypothetical protein